MRHFSLPAVIAAFVVAAAPACGVADPPATQQAAALSEKGGSALFEKNARPYGVSMERWSELLWRWIYRQPAEANPLLDPTGASCAVDQHGPVWFLASVIPGAPHFVGERSCTIPRHKALLVQTAVFLNDYPCPDPAFRPAPGQTLYDFLLEGAASFIDTVYFLEVSIDGVAQPDMLRFRFTSDDLFQIQGDLSLQTALDSCVTGGPQPAVSDGYSFMVKPLAPGEHTLVWHVKDTFGMTGDTTLTYHLTVQ